MNIIDVKSFSEKQKLLQAFDPATETWIVSDLQSKWEIQDKLLGGQAVLDEEAVLRASEFWTKLLLRTQPEWTLISRELFDQWIWNWIHENPLPWLKANESASVIHRHLEFFSPLLIEEGSKELIEEWFQNNPDSLIKWRHIYEICTLLWEEMAELKILSPSLVPTVLLKELKDKGGSQALDPKIWGRKIYLDLGLKPRLIETSLAGLLGEALDIQFISTSVDSSRLDLQGELVRLPTQLGEVKDAVSKIRGLLDSGIEPSRIALLAPDIEAFWPSLHFFFKSEGVPCNKPYVQRLINDPSIQKWLSGLRIQLDRFSSRDLESHFFQKAQGLAMSFDQFRYYFETLKAPQEVVRWKGWKSGATKLSENPLNLVEFFDWAVEAWPKEFSPDPLERVWKVLSKDFDPRLRMKANDWFFYVESKVSKAENSIEMARVHGLQLLSLTSSEWCEADHVFFLGLNEVELGATSKLLVSSFEADKIKQDLGFELDSQNVSPAELYLAWFSKRPLKKAFYLTSGVTFTGEEVAPSKHWLKSAFAQSRDLVRQVQSPGLIRFDEVARGAQVPQDSFQEFPLKDISLSATSIKSYFECPFIFFSQKVLRLADQPVLDFDLDPLNKGRLLHAVLEVLVHNEALWSGPEEGLIALIEIKREELDIQVGEERIWPAMKNELLQLAKNFISMEQELRRHSPRLRPLGSEINFTFYFDPESQTLHREQTATTQVKFTGRIDRVDGGDGEQVSVVDYKLSSGRLKGWGKWLEEGDLQMTLYALALKSGLTDLKDPHSVQAAYYVVPRTKERDRGFFLKGQSENLFVGPSTRSHSWITDEKLEALIESTKSVLQEVIQRIQAGNLGPAPRKYELCDSCRWRNLCRAPHLI